MVVGDAAGASRSEWGGRGEGSSSEQESDQGIWARNKGSGESVQRSSESGSVDAKGLLKQCTTSILFGRRATVYCS